MTGLQRTTITSMIRAVILYRSRLHPRDWEDANVPSDQIVRLYYGQRDRWHECKAIGISVFRGIHAPAAAVGACAFLLCDAGIPKVVMLEFMEQVTHGAMPAHSPITSLRRVMATYAIQHRQTDCEPLAYLLRAWNLYSEQAKVDIISWKPDDGMPRISTKLIDCVEPL